MDAKHIRRIPLPAWSGTGNRSETRLDGVAFEPQQLHGERGGSGNTKSEMRSMTTSSNLHRLIHIAVSSI